MAIQISNTQNKMILDRKAIKKKATLILNALGCPEAELSLLFTDDEGIREINKEYRGKDKATNVLAFAMNEGEFADINPEVLGDVVISTETNLREAMEWEMDPEIRLSQLLIHGVLHLLGYDHERGPEEEKRMEEKSTELIRILENREDLIGWLSL